MNNSHGGNIWRIAKENGLKPENIIDFSASINPLGMSPKAEAAIKKTISSLGHYPEPDAETIRTELATYHNMPAENILAGNGSTEFIYLLPQVFKPNKALIIEPSFSEYKNSLAVHNCKTNSFILPEEKDFALDAEKLLSLLRNAYNLLYLGNPANPTGIVLDKETIVAIAEECKRYGTIFVVDEAFMDFSEKDSVKHEATVFDNLIVLRSMTKFFAMPGLRLGYIIAHENIIKRFENFMPPWSVNTLAAIAGIESLRDKGHIKKTREWLASEMPFLMQGLCAMPYLKTYPSKANYLLVKILFPAILAEDIQRELLKSGILIRDCGNFVGLGSDFFRAAVKGKEENQLLLAGLNKIFVALKRS